MEKPIENKPIENIAQYFLSYELAQFAKSKNFDEKSFAYYDKNTYGILCSNMWNGGLLEVNGVATPHESQIAFYAPHHEQLFNWLIKKHGIHIVKLPSKLNVYAVYKDYGSDTLTEICSGLSLEKAEEEALRHI